MPAEWEPHAATWLAWPHNPTDWPDKLDTIRWVYGEIVRKIAPGETVRMLVNSKAEAVVARRYLARAGAAVDRVEFLVHPTNRGWTRDSGPIFVRRCRGTQARDRHRPFPFQRLGQISRLAEGPPCAGDGRRSTWASASSMRPVVLEGGGIDVNGRGTLLTTEECYLDPRTQVRNPGMGRNEFEAALRQSLGVTNVFWLAGGLVGDDTHGHVDDICRFVNAKTVVLIRERTPATSIIARWRRTGSGSRTCVWRMARNPKWYRFPCPHRSTSTATACPPAMPTSTSPMRRCSFRRSTTRTIASRSAAWANCLPDRPVVGIHAVDLVLGFGTLHCLTQQQPAE